MTALVDDPCNICRSLSQVLILPMWILQTFNTLMALSEQTGVDCSLLSYRSSKSYALHKSWHKYFVFLVEIFGDGISKHRSCWLHVVAHHYNHEKKITLEVVKEIKKGFRHISPCFFGTFPHRKRSKRKSGLHVIPSIRKKLDTETFEHYME